VDSYRYLIDEMWGKLKTDLESLCLPDNSTKYGQRLYEELTAREFGYTLTGQKINLESKRDMKKRGISSPDIVDALAVMYAMDVAMLNQLPNGEFGNIGSQQAEDDYDPHANI